MRNCLFQNIPLSTVIKNYSSTSFIIRNRPSKVKQEWDKNQSMERGGKQRNENRRVIPKTS